MRALLAGIAIILPLLLCGQYDRYISQGDKSLEKREINGALLKYLDAYSDSSTQFITRKIASTYYLAGEWEKAESWFFKLLTYPDQSPDDYLDYIKCLAFQDKGDKALEFFSYLKEYFPEYKYPEGFEFWLIQRFSNPCQPDVTKNARISYCITINATESLDPGNPKLKFYWKFDDGTTAEGPKVKHCWRTAGNHEFTLTSVDSSLGHVRKSDSTFTVSFVEEAKFKLSGNKEAGSFVNFYAYNLKEHPDYYGMVWELSDGTLHYKEAFVHDFYRPGTYTITLHVYGKNDLDQIYQIACLKQNWTVTREK
ncbi:MAG: PKD domain-containing protein [Luteibaculum sp.]